MTDHKARFVTEPTIALMGQMALVPKGVAQMLDWVKSRAPECVPDEITDSSSDIDKMQALFPHDLTQDGRLLTDNELMVELAGRGCYLSFGNKAGRKTNREYIAHTQEGAVPHRSITYHAKLTFFIAGVSRRVSHELIRNYVGADRTEEGAPSQQSTRYVENPGFFVVHPRYLEESQTLYRLAFERICAESYGTYRQTIADEIESHQRITGQKPKGMAYKRILESASSLLPHSTETSFMWTTNPAALAKMALERDNEFADLEFQRLMRKWKRVVMEHCPNLFPAAHMSEGL